MPGAAAGAESFDLTVVGGGIVGLSTAWRARQAGMSVALLERGAIGDGASSVAAGMLAPVAEVEFGAAGRHLLELGLSSARMWPGFASELERAAGEPVGLLETGTLIVARDDDEARELERQLEFRRSLGLRAERLRPSEAREREPALAPTLRMAVAAPDDHSVEPLRVLGALRRACELSGVQLRERTAVRSLALAAAGGRVAGVRLGDGQMLASENVVLAAGPWSGQLEGVPQAAQIPIRPVKGQIMRLRDPAGPGLLAGVVRFEGGYLVPRGDGRYVLGGTMEERGFDREPTAGGVYELLRNASELVPGIDELRIEALSVGLRPASPDNVPAIGPGAVRGLCWATGHHRNGILLAPLTARLLLAALASAGERGAVRRRDDDGEGRDDDGGEGGSGDDGEQARDDGEQARLLAGCDPLRFSPAPGGASAPVPDRAEAGAGA